MKNLNLLFVTLLLLTVACKKTEKIPAADTAIAPDTIAAKKETTEAAKLMDSAAMMKAWEAYAKPGDAHKTLAMDNGNWSCKSTMWMGPDDQKPMKTTMSATSKMILGGRYQEARYTGNMMGQPFEGISTVGYDNASKELVSNWMDNMGTNIMQMRGKYDGTSKTMEMKGQCTDPMTGKQKSVRETYTLMDDNTRKMEMYDTDASGKEYKSMEIVMTRTK